MQPWLIWSAIGAAVAILGIIGYTGYIGFRSSLRPLLIFRTGWTTAIRCFLAIPRAVLGISFVILTGAGLQLLSTAFPIVNERTLVIASVVWQALMATALAALAVFVHLFIVHDVFAERRFGAETHFYRGPALNQSLHPRPPPLPLLLRAAVLGFGIWLVTYALQIGTNVLILFAPQFFRFAPPNVVGLTAYCAATFVSFLIVTLLSLVRPALSLGSRQPVLLGIGAAIRRAPALYVVTVLLLIAPAIIGWLTIFIPHQFFPASAAARVVGTVIFLIFSIFQMLAVESSTVFFMNRAMNQLAEPMKPEQAAATAQSTP